MMRQIDSLPDSNIVWGVIDQSNGGETDRRRRVW